MNTQVSHEQIAELFPGIEDHTVVEIMETGATLDDLEAAFQWLQSGDEPAFAARRQDSSRFNRLLGVLTEARVQPAQDRT